MPGEVTFVESMRGHVSRSGERCRLELRDLVVRVRPVPGPDDGLPGVLTGGTVHYGGRVHPVNGGGFVALCVSPQGGRSLRYRIKTEDFDLVGVKHVTGRPWRWWIDTTRMHGTLITAGHEWSGTHALAQGHLDSGRQVWLVTAAPVDLGAVIAHRLGLTGAIGTMAEVRDGLYTGRLVGGIMHGPAKAAAVREVAVRERLDLAQCWAYSDSVNDLPMLTAVGHPVAVNPDPALRRVAADRGWEGHDFRTGRKAAQVAIVVGAVAGAAAATVALNRRGLTRTLLAQLSKARPT